MILVEGGLPVQALPEGSEARGGYSPQLRLIELEVNTSKQGVTPNCLRALVGECTDSWSQKLVGGAFRTRLLRGVNGFGVTTWFKANVRGNAQALTTQLF